MTDFISGVRATMSEKIAAMSWIGGRSEDSELVFFEVAAGCVSSSLEDVSSSSTSVGFVFLPLAKERMEVWPFSKGFFSRAIVVVVVVWD